MSYPLLHLTGDYAKVEIRKGRGADRWDDMEEIFNGPADEGKEWKAGEGAKLSGCVCLMPDDPDSTMSLPYSVTGVSGLSTGKAKVRRFPTTVGGFSERGFSRKRGRR